MARPVYIVPLVVASGLFLENMDGTVLATSLPAMALDLGQDPITLKLVFTSYLLSLAVFIPVSGWCADRFGARNVFRLAIAIFTLGSLACAFSSTLGGFVAARILQGLGGAMMTPVGRLIVLRAVPKAELVRAMAWLTIPALVGPVIGPVVGGFITTHLHWRWIFWMNLPIGLLGLVLATLYIEDQPGGPVRRLDWVGLLLSGLGMASLASGVTVIGSELLPGPVVAALILGGAALLGAYVLHARGQAHPVLELALFRIATFRSAALGGLAFRMGIGAVPFLLPLMLQVGFGLSALQSGLLTFAAAAGAFVMKFTAGWFLRRFGFRQILIWNALAGGVLLAGMGLIGPHTPYVLVYALLLTSGYFRSLQFTGLNTLVYADVPQEQMSAATSLSAVMQQLSSSFGVAIAAIVLEIMRSGRADASISVADFSVAFLVMGLITASAVLPHLRLTPDAGREVSGHGRSD